MIPTAIHGKGTRGWDMPLLSKRTGCSPLVGCEEQSHFHCSGLYLVGEEQDSLWAGMSSSKHRAKTGSYRGWEYPQPSSNALFGVQSISKAHREQWCCYFHPQREAIESSKWPERCCIENTNDSALEWKFLFLFFGLSDLVPILQLESFKNVLLQARPAMPLLLSKF